MDDFNYHLRLNDKLAIAHRLLGHKLLVIRRGRSPILVSGSTGTIATPTSADKMIARGSLEPLDIWIVVHFWSFLTLGLSELQ